MAWGEPDWGQADWGFIEAATPPPDLAELAIASPALLNLGLPLPSLSALNAAAAVLPVGELLDLTLVLPLPSLTATTPPRIPPTGVPVKTNILQTLETMISGVSNVGSVRRWEDIPFDLTALDPADFPILFFWEEEEKEKYNRLSRNTLDLWMQAFFPLDAADPASFTEFSESAEAVTAEITGMFAVPAALRAAGVIQIEPQQVYKARYNSDYGVLFLSYRIIYVHAAGDAYSLEV